MNWMTSSRHRALRSTRGKKRAERTFPPHILRRHELVARAHATDEHTERCNRKKENDSDPWYIRPVMDQDESQDILMLEFARQNAAMVPTTVEPAIPASTATTKPSTPDTTEKQKKISPSERRCVFTPVKSTRRRPQPQRQARQHVASPPKSVLLFDEGKELGKKASRCDEDSSFVPSTLKSGVDQASMHSLQRAQRDRTQPLLQPQASYASSWAQENHNTLSAENRISVPFYEDGSPCNMVEERGDHFSRTSPGDDTLPRCIGVGQEAGEYSTNSVFGLTRAPAADYGSRPSPPSFKLEFQSAQQYSWSDRDSGSRMRDEAGSISRAFQPTSSLLLERRASINERPESPTSAYDGGRSPSLTPPPQGSVSSQDSITVPPPADWHKNLAKRSRDPVGDYSGMSLSPHAAMFNREASTSHSSPTVTHIQERKVSWSMAPRTERILCEISNRAAHPDRSLMTPSTKLRMRCVKKEDVAAYMFTLLQCYRINERLQQEPVPCSTTAEFKARSSS